MFICDFCNYKTENKSNFNRHIKSKKHVKIVSSINKSNFPQISSISGGKWRKKTTNQKNDDEKMRCKYCGRKFSRNDNLQRHFGICKIKKKQDDELKIKMLIIEEKDKIIIEEKDKMINVLEKELKFNKNISIGAGMIMTKTLKYLESRYPDAPVLEKINLLSIEGIENEINFVENLIIYQKRKTLAIQLGDIIYEQYKKDDTTEQSIWSSDVSRMNYLIREIIDKNIGWNSDKKGIKIRNLIVEPLLQKISELITNYIMWKSNHILSGHTEEAIESVEFLSIANEIFMNIRDNILEKEIMKYITPKFQIEIK